MSSLSTWFRYLAHKLEYSVAIGYTGYKSGAISDQQAIDVIWKHMLHGRITYLHWNKGTEMAPTVGERASTLLVRKLPHLDLARRVSVGDVVVLRDPRNSDNYLVRRLAAVQGYEMVSTNEKDEPFVLDENECWVLADNEKLKPKEANDSRTFGPVTMSGIVGRVIYFLQTAVDHGPVQNSRFSTQVDSPVLAVELDVDEMAKNHKP